VKKHDNSNFLVLLFTFSHFVTLLASFLLQLFCHKLYIDGKEN